MISGLVSLQLTPKTKYIDKFHRLHQQTQAYASPISNLTGIGNISCEAGTLDGVTILSSDPVIQQELQVFGLPSFPGPTPPTA